MRCVAKNEVVGGSREVQSAGMREKRWRKAKGRRLFCCFFFVGRDLYLFGLAACLFVDVMPLCCSALL